MRIALAQFNSVVGDLDGNVERMHAMYTRALEHKPDLLAFPELALCGYPPEDLLFKAHFIAECAAAAETLAKLCPETTLIVGLPHRSEGANHNAAAVIREGKVIAHYHKARLPNYGVFDEQRYFKPGREPLKITIDDIHTAVTICRDIWELDWLAEFLKGTGPTDLVLNISASPFHLDKITRRQKIVADFAIRLNAAVAYCNMVGGQDELVFDGRSLLTDPSGRTVAMAAGFDEDLLIADVTRDHTHRISITPVTPSGPIEYDSLDEIHRALVLGTRDYLRKNGFHKALIGLSGGIDSSLVAAIAAEALGPKNVIGVTMPSRFNTSETISDAEKLARNLGIEFHTIPIAPVLDHFDNALAAVPGWDDKGIAFENLQARIRGTMLMSLSNQFGAMVLTTGNKSETAVGYATLYGDTAGGFAVIKDVFKTAVYSLCEYINEKAGREIIPADVTTRCPSAELRADQKDTDSLPEYPLLDEILKGYVEQDMSAKDLIDSGLDKHTVQRVIRMVDRNEYKRRQCPPGVKITPKAFGRDRRLPITNQYRQFPNG